MSGRIPGAAVKNTGMALVVTALLSSAVHGGNSSVPSGSNTPAKKDKVTTQTAPLPPSKPAPPAARGPVSFTPQMPFGEAIEILRNSAKPPLNIIVLWKQIGDGAGIYRDTAIGIDGVAGLGVGQCLDLLMLSLSAGASAKLGYVVNKGVITISTTDALPAPKLVTRIYDISDLVAPPARYAPATMGFGMGYGLGYGGQAAPFGGYAVSPGAGSYGPNPGSGLSSPTGRTIGQSPRSSRSR